MILRTQKKVSGILSAALLLGLGLGLSITGTPRPALASIGTDSGRESAEVEQTLQTGDLLREASPLDGDENGLDVVRTGNSAPDRSPAVLPADDAETIERHRTMYLDYSEEAPSE